MSKERLRWSNRRIYSYYENRAHGFTYEVWYNRTAGKWLWHVRGYIGPHFVEIRSRYHYCAPSQNQAKRRAREAGLMLQKLVEGK